MSNQKRGLVRLVSAAAALVLIIAHIIGGYAHAAGHIHAKAHAELIHEHAVTQSVVVHHEPADHGTGHSDTAIHVESCDFMCNGGIAILVTACFVCIEATPTCSSAIAAIAHLLLPASLERPPKSFVRA